MTNDKLLHSVKKGDKIVFSVKSPLLTITDESILNPPGYSEAAVC
ncbi:hypothetical protein [Coleofasciculus sp.]